VLPNSVAVREKASTFGGLSIPPKRQWVKGKYRWILAWGGAPSMLPSEFSLDPSPFIPILIRPFF
jgi:hypothetical protein